MMIVYKHILIIGIGLIGGSVAAAIKATDDSAVVYGVDSSPVTVKEALEKGYVDFAALDSCERVEKWLGSLPEDESAENPSIDLVILATPVSAAITWLERIELSGYSGTITDVASTKGVLCKEALRILSKPERFIPGHPMAGSEVNGIEGARATLFKGAHWILCPDDKADGNSDAERFIALHEFVMSLGARPITVDRFAHDDVVAIVSHVPHMIAASLVQLAGEHAGKSEELFRLAAGGFKDTTRIAAGSPQLWSGIAVDNHEALVAGLGEFRQILTAIEDAIRLKDVQQIERLLAGAAQLRQTIPAQWLPKTERLVEFRIAMANRSGVVAEVTGLAAKAGCNILSIDIDHITADTAVLELVLTDEGDIGRFSGMLWDAGFDVSMHSLNAQN